MAGQRRGEYVDPYYQRKLYPWDNDIVRDQPPQGMQIPEWLRAILEPAQDPRQQPTTLPGGPRLRPPVGPPSPPLYQPPQTPHWYNPNTPNPPGPISRMMANPQGAVDSAMDIGQRYTDAARGLANKIGNKLGPAQGHRIQDLPIWSKLAGLIGPSGQGEVAPSRPSTGSTVPYAGMGGPSGAMPYSGIVPGYQQLAREGQTSGPSTAPYFPGMDAIRGLWNRMTSGSDDEGLSAEEEDPRNVENDRRLAMIEAAGASTLKGDALARSMGRPPQQKPRTQGGMSRSNQTVRYVPITANDIPEISGYSPGFYNWAQSETDFPEAMPRQIPIDPEDNVIEAEAVSSKQPVSDAMQRFIDHIGKFPEYSSPGIWSRIGAGIVGGAEGLRSGAGAGFQAAQNALNAPYTNAVNRWAQQGSALEKAAELEGSQGNAAFKQALEMAKFEDISNDRRVRQQQAERRVQGYLRNTTAREAMLQIRRMEADTRQYQLQEDANGNIISVNKRTGETIDTGIPSMAYARFRQQVAYQGAQIGLGAERNRISKEAGARGWSIEEWQKARYKFENPDYPY